MSVCHTKGVINLYSVPSQPWVQGTSTYIHMCMQCMHKVDIKYILSHLSCMHDACKFINFVRWGNYVRGGVVRATVGEVHTATELTHTTPQQHTAYISIIITCTNLDIEREYSSWGGPYLYKSE